MAPLVSHAQNQGLLRAEAYGQLDCFAAGLQFAKAEGILPAPEPTHAIKGVIEAARRAEAAGKEQVILFNLCGHGHFDMQAYDDYLAGPAAGSRDAGGRARPRARGDRRLPARRPRASADAHDVRRARRCPPRRAGSALQANVIQRSVRRQT